MFAALNTVEPPILALNVVDLQPRRRSRWAEQRRQAIIDSIASRLDSVAAFLDDRDHLVDGRFTAADLLMTTVLRILRDDRPGAPSGRRLPPISRAAKPDRHSSARWRRRWRPSPRTRRRSDRSRDRAPRY